MNLATFLAGMQAAAVTLQATSQAMHQSGIGGKTDQSHLDQAVSLFAIIGGAVSMFSQAFHAAQGGTPVAAPAAPASPAA